MTTENAQRTTPEEAAGGALLSLSQAAARLGVSRSTMYRLLEAGRFRGTKVGRQWRFRTEDLDAYLRRSPTAAIVAPEAELDEELAFFAARVKETDVAFVESMADPATMAPAEAKTRQLLALVLCDAFFSRASDIHFEPTGRPNEGVLLYRLRIDGVMQEIRRFPLSLHEPIIAWLKRLAGLDPSDHSSPRLARIWMDVKGRRLTLKTTFAPTVFGEAVTLRILDASSVLPLTMDDMGLFPENRTRLGGWLERSNGLVVVSGPTGSGKTTLLYCCVQHVTDPARKTITIEDPVDYVLPLTTQLQVDARTGATASSCLQAAMQMDPDVLMLDELCDVDAVTGCCQAALTGHLVLTQMHADDAVSALLRLATWGVEPFLLASALTGISCQRLVRRLCKHCTLPASPDAVTLAKARELASDGGYEIPGDARFMRPVGCDKCHGGYRHRAGVYQLLELSDALREAFLHGAGRDRLTSLALSEGMNTLAADGIRKAVEGVTSLDEVFRVLSC